MAWVPFLFLCHMENGEYATVRIEVICNYAPDDELDDNGYPALHFWRDAAGNFYNARIRNLFTTMQTMMCRAGFFPDVGMMILLDSVAVMDVCMLMSESHIRLVRKQRISSSFAVPTSLSEKHNCICSLQVRKSCRCHGVWAQSSRHHPAMVAQHELLSKVSDSERVSQQSAEHAMAKHWNIPETT